MDMPRHCVYASSCACGVDDRQGGAWAEFIAQAWPGVARAWRVLVPCCLCLLSVLLCAVPVNRRAAESLCRCTACANPAIRGWGATHSGIDAQARRQVPGPYQLPLAITGYVPTAVGVTLCRTPSVDIK